jgi:hypothetical protein
MMMRIVSVALFALAPLAGCGGTIGTSGERAIEGEVLAAACAGHRPGVVREERADVSIVSVYYCSTSKATKDFSGDYPGYTFVNDVGCGHNACEPVLGGPRGTTILRYACQQNLCAAKAPSVCADHPSTTQTEERADLSIVSLYYCSESGQPIDHSGLFLGYPYRNDQGCGDNRCDGHACQQNFCRQKSACEGKAPTITSEERADVSIRTIYYCSEDGQTQDFSAQFPDYTLRNADGCGHNACQGSACQQNLCRAVAPACLGAFAACDPNGAGAACCMGSCLATSDGQSGYCWGW